MTIKPVLVDLQKASPEPIRVILESNEGATVDVKVTVCVLQEPRKFALHAGGERKLEHDVIVDPDLGGLCHMHDWGPANAFDKITVTVIHPNGDAQSADAQVIPSAPS